MPGEAHCERWRIRGGGKQREAAGVERELHERPREHAERVRAFKKIRRGEKERKMEHRSAPVLRLKPSFGGTVGRSSAVRLGVCDHLRKAFRVGG